MRLVITRLLTDICGYIHSNDFEQDIPSQNSNSLVPNPIRKLPHKPSCTCPLFMQHEPDLFLAFTNRQEGAIDQVWKSAHWMVPWKMVGLAATLRYHSIECTLYFTAAKCVVCVIRKFFFWITFTPRCVHVFNLQRNFDH